MAALLLILGQGMTAQAQETRVPIDAWVEATPGTSFAFMDQLGQRTGWLQDCLKLLEVIDPEAKRLAPVASMAGDLLSRRIAIARESYGSHLLTLKALFAMHGPTLGPEAFRQTSAIVMFPDDSSESVDASQALRLSYAILSRLDSQLRTRRFRRDVAGSYRVKVRGTCPLAAGELAMTQHGPYLEGVRGGKVLLEGVVGEGMGWFVANVQRYATVKIQPGSPQALLAAPDQPAPFLGGRLEPRQFELVEQRRGDCTLRLQRIGS